ncbi:MAG TPA: hypothetical protein VGK59_17105 [Ohtaekwangia sp.]
MKSKIYLFLIAVAFVVTGITESFAQGCVAVRQMGGNTICATEGYNLPKGEFQIGATYRYFHSWRHFVGSEEQKERQTEGGGHDENGKERGNAVNIYSHSVELNLNYGLTDRLQLNLAIPYVHNERSQVFRANQDNTMATDTFRYSLYAKGIADIRLSANYWVFNPQTSMKGNLLVGLGMKLNSGSYTRTGMVPVVENGASEVTYEKQTMDQAIQPGDGGVGFSLELSGFRQIYRGVYGFFAGYYLFNPKENNGSYKSDPTIVRQDGVTLDTLFGYNLYACPDQYFVRGGIMGAVGKKKNLTLSAALRAEGIPAYDALGGQVAYRRPGYVVAVESGLAFKAGKHSFSLIIPYNFYKNRIQSAADIKQQDLRNSVIEDENEKVHVQGDAAFADYSINFNYTYRLGKLFGEK